jgi:hypothetical protein
MVEWTAQVEMIRTTRDGSGGWCGVVTGMGGNPEQALAELRRRGQELARRLVQEKAEAHETDKADRATKSEADERAAYKAESDRVQKEEHRVRVPYEAMKAGQRRAYSYRQPRDEGPRLFRFEVVDVRLTPAPEENERSGWLAYGTLARLSESQD